jgi:hypothetical protein
LPYRLDYELTTSDRYVTSRLVITTQGQGWRRALELHRATSGEWSCRTEAEGAPDLPHSVADLSALAGAFDCDVGLSPLTNSMPVLRHHLHERAGTVDFLMAWVSVPDLTVHPSRQRYTFVRQTPDTGIVGFKSLDDDFAAQISFDREGLVLDYPGLGRRMS